MFISQEVEFLTPLILVVFHLCCLMDFLVFEELSAIPLEMSLFSTVIASWSFLIFLPGSFGISMSSFSSWITSVILGPGVFTGYSHHNLGLGFHLFLILSDIDLLCFP